jgi:hypothetical protein
MKKKLQIFVSSTYTDLIEERQAAVSAILKAGHIPAGMELFTAGDESQMETIKRWIKESDAFMLILGGRYGSIEPTTKRSYTELEYDYAVESGMPYFAVVIEESALDQKVRQHGLDIIETENSKKLEAFRKKVLNRTSAFYKDVQDIRLAVYETISDFIGRHEFKGWVSGDEIPDIQSFTDQINKLREENKQLSIDRNALQAGAVFTPSEETEFNHIRQKLDRDVNLHHELYQKREGEETTIKVGTEVYKTNLLSSIIAFVKKGRHRFNKGNIEFWLYNELNDAHPLQLTPEIKRNLFSESIKDKIDLELQTYGLNRFVEAGKHSQANSLYEFTEKMYRFAYWLDYNGYTPETRFEFVSMIEESVPAVSPSKKEIPALKTIKEIDRALNFKAQRNKWRTTEEGVTSAEQEFNRLCNELKDKVNDSNGESETFDIDFSREGQNQCKVFAMGISSFIVWNCECTDTLDGSLLTVKFDKTKFDIEGVQSFLEEQAGFREHELDIDLDKDLKVMWRRREDNNTFVTDELVSNLITELAKEIHNRITRDK